MKICLLVAVLLPILSKIPVAFAMHKLSRYDNHHPRAQQAQLTGVGARALAAHQNSFEALTIFSTAALTAMVTNHVTWITNLLGIAFVLARVMYHLFYILDLALMRSIVWGVAYISSITILGLSISW